MHEQEKIRTNQDPEQENMQHAENDDYRRDGSQLGSQESVSNSPDTTGGPQKGGGGSGYDANEEQEQVNKEQEIMHNERDEDQLQPERTETPRPETNPAREQQPGTTEQPITQPGTGTPDVSANNQRAAWSQSSLHTQPQQVNKK